MCNGTPRRGPPRQERAVVVHRRSSEEAREEKKRETSHHFFPTHKRLFGGFVTSYTNVAVQCVDLSRGGHEKAQMTADATRGGTAHDVVQTPSSDDTQPGADPPPPIPVPFPKIMFFPSMTRASKSSNRARIDVPQTQPNAIARGSCVETRLLRRCASPLFSPAVGDPSRLRCVHVALFYYDRSLGGGSCARHKWRRVKTEAAFVAFTSLFISFFGHFRLLELGDGLSCGWAGRWLEQARKGTDARQTKDFFFSGWWTRLKI